MGELLDRIVIDPDILVGKSVMKGTCVPVHLFIELLANGMTTKPTLKEYPNSKKKTSKQHSYTPQKQNNYLTSPFIQESHKIYRLISEFITDINVNVE
jgi:uncharacterized protein (DUF433 family)